MAQLVLKNILAGSGNVLAGGDNSGNVTKITIGSGLTLTSGVLSSTGGGSGTVTSVAMSVPTGLSIAGSPITTSGTLALTYSTGYSIPTTVKQSNWDDAYTWVTGFPTQTGNSGKFLTTDGSALSWATISVPVTSVFGRTGAVVATAGDYNTDLVTEGSTNLYYTNARARAAFSANVGSALTYNSSTGRYTLLAADTATAGYLTAADWNTFNGKQNSLGTGTTAQFLRGDLVWATPPTPALEDLTGVAITSPTNGQVLTYRFGDWRNETPPTAPVTSVFGRTGIIVATSGDYTTDLVTEATNLYYTNARARGSVSVDVGSALTYNSTTGRFSLPAATALNDGYLTALDYADFDSKQASLGTGTTSQFLRGDLVWAAPPTPALDDLTDVGITSPTNGQLLRYQLGTWINFTPTYVSAGYFSATAPLAYNSGTGVFSISQATTSTNGYLSSTDFNTFNGKQAQLNGTGFVKASGTTITYDNSTYLTTSSAASTYLALTGGTLSGNLTATGFFESSDKRLKTQLEANYAPQNVGDIQAYLYIKDGKEEVGYYAQEVSEIIPSAVAEGKDGFLTVAYNQVLVAKIQNLENELKAIKDELGRISK